VELIKNETEDTGDWKVDTPSFSIIFQKSDIQQK